MRVWLLSFILFVTGCDDAKDNKIRIGLSPDYPPFEFNQKSNLKGFDVDLVTMIMKDNKMDFEVLNFIPDNFINPQKRIFLGYLFSGFLIAFLWLYCFRKY